MVWVVLILVGAAVGALGRLLHPGREPMGFLVTALIGVCALVAAGVIFSSNIWAFVVGIPVAFLLVWLFSYFTRHPAV